MTTPHRIGTGAFLALAIASSAAPASARPARFSPRQSTGQAPAAITRANVDAARASAPTSSTPAIVRLTAHASGFDWGDAGIGAAGGIALSMLGLGGALAVSQRRTQRTRHTTAATG